MVQFISMRLPFLYSFTMLTQYVMLFCSGSLSATMAVIQLLLLPLLRGSIIQVCSLQKYEQRYNLLRPEYSRSADNRGCRVRIRTHLLPAAD